MCLRDYIGSLCMVLMHVLTPRLLDPHCETKRSMAAVVLLILMSTYENMHALMPLHLETLSKVTNHGRR